MASMDVDAADFCAPATNAHRRRRDDDVGDDDDGGTYRYAAARPQASREAFCGWCWCAAQRGALDVERLELELVVPADLMPLLDQAQGMIGAGHYSCLATVVCSRLPYLREDLRERVKAHIRARARLPADEPLVYVEQGVQTTARYDADDDYAA